MRLIILSCLIILLSSCDEGSDRYNGYIDADLIYLSSSFPGRLDELLIRRGDKVESNQLLFKVEQANDDFSISISELTQKDIIEQKNELLNQITYDEQNYQRIQKMHREDAASQNDLELARRDLAILKNKLTAINAQLKSNELATKNKRWDRSRKEGFANQNGIIFDTYFTKNEFVPAGQPVLSLLTPEKVKLTFFIPEPKLKIIALNNKIKFYSGDQLLGEGVIDYISKIAQYTPPIIYSREDSYNLVFRVEARLFKPDLNRIHLGQPVNLEVLS